MSSLAVTNTLANGTTIQASDHNTNYSDIVNYVNNRNAGSSTWDAVSTLSASSVPLTADNSSGTADIVQFKDNGSSVFVIADGGIVTMANQPAVRAYRNTTNQTIADSGTPSKIQFNAETYDVKSEYDPSVNYRYTATVTGKYLITSTLQVTAGASSTDSTIHVYKNGSSISSVISVIGSGITSNVSICEIVSLSATDYIEIFASFNSSATNTDVVAGEAVSWLAIHKVA